MRLAEAIKIVQKHGRYNPHPVDEGSRYVLRYPENNGRAIFAASTTGLVKQLLERENKKEGDHK